MKKRMAVSPKASSSRARGAALLVVGLVGSVVAIAAPVGGQNADWNGFTIQTAPTVVGTEPAWGLGVTEDLAGPGVDVWNNNHFFESEAHLDLFTGSQSGVGSIALGEGTQRDNHGVAFSDIDGDGDDDLFELSGRSINQLWRNNNGTLTPIAAPDLNPTVLLGGTPTQGRGRQPLFYDADNDGDMDVLTTNLDMRAAPINGATNVPSDLFLNNGNGTSWTKVADPSEAISNGNLRIAQQTSTGPGDEQIIITHNSFSVVTDSVATGSTSLAESAIQATRRNGVTHVREVLVGDFDGDLHPELLVVRGDASSGGGPFPLEIYNLVDGRGSRSATLPTGPLVDNCRSAASGDFDNDGDLDILAGCAQKEEGQTRNIILVNNGVGNFSIAGTDLLPASIAQTPGSIISADLNKDGWLDLFVGNGYDADIAPDQIYLNRGGGQGHWLQVELVGSNPDAAGAQVFLGTDKWQVLETGHRNHRSQSSGILHFGLGDKTQISKLEIRWPDGTFQSCSVSGVDRRVTVTQGGPGCSGSGRAAMLATLAATPVLNTDTTPPPPPPTQALCAGFAVTVDLSLGQSPTQGADVVLGTAGPDVINGLGGNDLICGKGGDDIINGGSGNDRIFGNAGRDTINGGAGNDIAHGGNRPDIIFGGGGNDRLVGNNRADVIRGGPGNDTLLGKVGRDTLIGGAGNDAAIGGGGRDRCSAESRSSCELGL